MELKNNPKINKFIENRIEFDTVLDLPHFYPKKGKFDEFQYGYRYNPISKQTLIGSEEGDWEKDWFVICSNYFNDPFVINVSEKELNYPVYFARHGEGKWNLEKVNESIKDFENLLKEIKPLEEDYLKAIEVIKKQSSKNFWNQIIEELNELKECQDEEE